MSSSLPHFVTYDPHTVSLSKTVAQVVNKYGAIGTPFHYLSSRRVYHFSGRTANGLAFSPPTLGGQLGDRWHRNVAIRQYINQRRAHFPHPNHLHYFNDLLPACLSPPWPYMVNEEPGDGEPEVKVGIVNLPPMVAEQEVVEEENFFSDSDSEASNTDSDTESSDGYDSESEDEGIVRSDQEDSEDESENEAESEGEEDHDVPFDNDLMEMMPDGDLNVVLTYEKAICNLVNKEPAALVNGVNNETEYRAVREHQRCEDELAEYARRQTHLWPHVREAVELYRKSGRLSTTREVGKSQIPETVKVEYEEAVTSLLEGLERPSLPEGYERSSDHQTWEAPQESVEYEDKRANRLLDMATKFHEIKNSRPGEQHVYGEMMPVQFSYDMIEYLMCAMGSLGFDFKKNMSENWEPYPETDEMSMETRRQIEMVIVMDPAYRNEFFSLVNEMCTQAGAGLSDDEKGIIGKLFDEMNSIFDGQFENYVLYEDEKAKRSEAMDEVIESDPARFAELLKEGDEAFVNIMAQLTPAHN